MFCIPSFDEMTNLTPYVNHVIPAYAGIQTVSHSASQVEEISETGSYESMIRYSGARAVPMRLLPDKGYHPDLDDLASKINRRTRLIILNSPQNPTGSVLSRQDLAARPRNTVGECLGV